ncbi:hypothetical protein ACSBR1_008483 [Camellia fascicularis]
MASMRAGDSFIEAELLFVWGGTDVEGLLVKGYYMAYVRAHLGGWLVRVAPGLAILLASQGRGQGHAPTPALSAVSTGGVGAVVVEGLLVMPYAISVMVGEDTVALPILVSTIVPSYLPPGVEQVPQAYVEACY